MILARLTLFVVLVAIAAVACADDASEELEQPSSGTDGSPTPRVSLDAPIRAERGTTVEIMLSVSNPAPTELEFYATEPIYDIVGVSPSGQEIWRSPSERVLVLNRHTIEPGGVLSFSEEWALVDASGAPLPEGNYTLQGFVYDEEPSFESHVVEMTITD